MALPSILSRVVPISSCSRPRTLGLAFCASFGRSVNRRGKGLLGVRFERLFGENLGRLWHGLRSLGIRFRGLLSTLAKRNNLEARSLASAFLPLLVANARLELRPAFSLWRNDAIGVCRACIRLGPG
jgi:hypothetical protein